MRPLPEPDPANRPSPAGGDASAANLAREPLEARSDTRCAGRSANPRGPRARRGAATRVALPPPSPAVLSRRARRARIECLIRLLDDESTTVWTHVRHELQRHGRAAESALKRAGNDASPRVRSRSRALLLSRGRERVVRRLIAFASRREVALESGLFLLSRLDQPDLDVRPYLMQIDALAAEVLRRVESRPPTLERAMVLVQYLGQELALRGDSEDYHHPDNIYLHRTLERRRGMPLTLAAIYHFVGTRAGIETSLVPLPGKVMLRVRGGDKTALIDVFDGGEPRTERELLDFLAEHNLPFRPTWFRNADDATMFQRQVANLRNSYAKRGMQREVRGLELVLAALERRAGLLASGTSA